MTREELVQQLTGSRVGSLQHSLRENLISGGRIIEVCTKCKVEVHASLTCDCGKQVTTIDTRGYKMERK